MLRTGWLYAKQAASRACNPLFLYAVACTLALGLTSAAQAQVTPTAITMGTNPIDTAGTIEAMWEFVSGPIGILFAFSVGITILLVVMRLIKRPVRGASR